MQLGWEELRMVMEQMGRKLSDMQMDKVLADIDDDGSVKHCAYAPIRTTSPLPSSVSSCMTAPCWLYR